MNTYNAHIQPHIDYGFALWGYAAKTHLDSVLKQQKKAVRILNFVKYADRRQPSKPLFEKSKILPLDQNLLLISGKIMESCQLYFMPVHIQLVHTETEHQHISHTLQEIRRLSW